MKLKIKNKIKEEQQKGQISTFGDLKRTINSIITKQKVAAAGSGVANFAVEQIAGVIPGLSNVKSAFEFFKTVYSATDDKKTNTVIDKLNVDDNYSKIVDDTVEIAFLKYISSAIIKQPDSAPIPPDFNINVELQKFLKSKYNQRTLTYAGNPAK